VNGGTFLAILALQICLDRRGFSPNAMDGQSGAKTRAALAAYCTANDLPAPGPAEEEFAFEKYFPDEPDLFTTVEVTAADIASLTAMPDTPEAKSRLPRMGYETIKEMFAERGHVTQNTLGRLNPHIVWENVSVGTKIKIPEVSPVAVGDKAAYIKVSLSRFSVTAMDINSKPMALFPCSIAKYRSKRPPPGEIRITTQIQNPNYTYTPDHTPRGRRVERHIFPPGPNNPVGTVWLGLSIPGYGIHGAPLPERIGRAESHGCFRLANWNAEKLYELVRAGTRVIIEP
jgi:lipoprotein-anchoring transpeptidase ErfK/SrfK